VQKNEEAEERKACTLEAHYSGGSSAMGFPFFREKKKKLHPAKRFQGIFKQ
jgi:hypothetical protein